MAGMKAKLFLAALSAWLIIGVAVAVEGQNNGRHKGWPNSGINEPGMPNHYASPHPHDHP